MYSAFLAFLHLTLPNDFGKSKLLVSPLLVILESVLFQISELITSLKLLWQRSTRDLLLK